MAETFYQQLELDTPMINFNGSLVHIPNRRWEWEKNVLIDKSYLFEFLKSEDTPVDVVPYFIFSALYPAKLTIISAISFSLF